MIIPTPSSPVFLSSIIDNNPRAGHMDKNVIMSVVVTLVIFIIFILALTCLWYKKRRRLFFRRSETPTAALHETYEQYHMAQVPSLNYGMLKLEDYHSVKPVYITQPPAAHMKPA